ncbi:hypothetical protein GH733_018746 [Mirounga leonina]|nr:hypothetical protein GH733_018746 [Mirounga leonina]
MESPSLSLLPSKPPQKSSSGPPRPVILLLGKYQRLAYHPHQANEVRASQHSDQVFSPGIFDVKPPRGFPAMPHTSLRTPCSQINSPPTSPNPCPCGTWISSSSDCPPTRLPSPRPQDVAHSPGGLGHLISSHLTLTTFPKDSMLLISITQESYSISYKDKTTFHRRFCLWKPGKCFACSQDPLLSFQTYKRAP